MTAAGGIALAPGDCSLMWSVAWRPKDTAAPSGDDYVIVEHADRVVVALVDGSGSGAEAAAAARRCTEEVRRHPGPTIEAVFAATHRRLKGSRGVAMALVILDRKSHAMTWAAVGDVDGMVLGNGPISPILRRPGTLGITYAGIFSQTVRLAAGAQVVLTTDGVSRDYATARPAKATGAATVAQIIHRFARPGDDSMAFSFEITAIPR